ncbi:MAG: VCBS repeat-containing protein [Thermoanaerobaculia bacterium]|nr:VCBS repeat-containing protein [Thermoanaerobaculia bacterium]
MFVRRFAVVLCLAAFALPGQLAAQTTQPAAPVLEGGIPEGGMPAWVRPETPEQRRERLSTSEDPGINPDPKKVFFRFGRPFHIERYERRWAAYDRDMGQVRPMANVNVTAEIYQQNEKFVWIWVPNPTDEELQAERAGTVVEAPPFMGRYNDQHIDFFGRTRSQWSTVTPPDSGRKLVFSEASKGLPADGSWRSSMDVADMNGDGFADLLIPPQRGGTSGSPTIFLGDGKGNWRRWDAVKWPAGIDYGSAVAADFNRDGKMDAAFAVHLLGVFAFLGDGKGNFTDSSEGLPKAFPTRRIRVADVDRDGAPDLIASSEGPVARAGGDPTAAKLRVFLNRNRGKKWEAMNVLSPSIPVGGDWVTVANLNGDKYPDFIGSNVYFGGTEVVHLSDGKGRWKVVESNGDNIPSLSYYFANAAAKIGSSKTDDAIVSYVHSWPSDLDERIVPKPDNMSVTAIDRITFTSKGVKRTPIVRWAGAEGVWALAADDMNGDGHADIVYTRHSPRELVILLGDGKGGFARASVEGVPLASNANYDVKLTDVNGDNRPDVVLMYETSGKTAFAPRDGAIQVFLNQTAAPTRAKAR